MSTNSVSTPGCHGVVGPMRSKARLRMVGVNQDSELLTSSKRCVCHWQRRCATRACLCYGCATCISVRHALLSIAQGLAKLARRGCVGSFPRRRFLSPFVMVSTLSSDEHQKSQRLCPLPASKLSLVRRRVPQIVMRAASQSSHLCAGHEVDEGARWIEKSDALAMMMINPRHTTLSCS